MWFHLVVFFPVGLKVGIYHYWKELDLFEGVKKQIYFPTTMRSLPMSSCKLYPFWEEQIRAESDQKFSLLQANPSTQLSPAAGGKPGKEIGIPP